MLLLCTVETAKVSKNPMNSFVIVLHFPWKSNSPLVEESKEEEGASELSCSLVLLSQASWAHFGDLLSSTDDTLTGNC